MTDSVSVSKAGLARRLKVSRARVGQLVGSGLPVRPDGKIDLDLALVWVRDHASSDSVILAAAGMGEAVALSVGPGAALDPDAPELTAFLANLAGGQWASQSEADRVKSNALAGLRVLEWRQKAGELIELAAAQTTFFECARAYRDALMSWPSQEGPLIAADLEIADSGKVARVLDDHIRKFLVTQGEPDASALPH